MLGGGCCVLAQDNDGWRNAVDLASAQFPRNSIQCISDHDFKLKPDVLKEKRFPKTCNSDGPIQLQSSSIMLCMLGTGLVK